MPKERTKSRRPVLGRKDRGEGRPAAREEELPLRSELFSVDQLLAHAKTIAGWHTLLPVPGPDRLLGRLDENEKVLLRAYELVAGAIARKRAITPASEWLVDNFYLIEEQIYTARRHLPRRYSRELPQLANGPGRGYPRVYHLSMELIAHLDGRVDAESLTSFIAAYQVTSPLKLGELWAIPIMLRLALIENLRRVAARVGSGREDWDRAGLWADRLIEVAETRPAKLIEVMADMARADPPLTHGFVAEFSRRLQGKRLASGMPLTWVEQRLAEQSQTIDECIQRESQNQAANQISIGNSIASVRVLGAIDWRDFVESMSGVEQILRREAAEVYGTMDFATRDRYRHVVENLAKHSERTEEEVAHEAVALAGQSAERYEKWDRRAHVGFYLIDKGMMELERVVGAKIPWRQRVGRWGERHAISLYLGSIGLLAGAFAGPLFVYCRSVDAAPWQAVILGIVLVLCGSHFAVAVVNWLVTRVIAPRVMPRLDFSKGIPSSYRTMVVVPTMLSSEEGVKRLVEELEVRYLANPDPSLHFALLTDFKDAGAESMPEDERLVEAARAGVAALNSNYERVRGDIFFLWHRPRRWNAREGRWMGYERKRGKLAEFNAFLRGKLGERFSVVMGDTGIVDSIRYVITLDTDTELPRDSARQMIATMAHPLMRAEADPVTGRIREGYAILQPRVAVSLPSASRSWFVKLFAGEPGLDPYTRAVSDVYEDLFKEGSFTGKGIYDVDAFEKSLEGRFPENRILSHDLIEGCFARAGLVSDIQLYEDHPAHYLVDMKRRHRWIRGDWQIASWLLPSVPGAGGRMRNTLSGVSRWKIADNLRRSLVAPAMVLLLLLSWVGAVEQGVAALAVLGAYFVPMLLTTAMEMWGKSRDMTWMQHARYTWNGFLHHGAQIVVTLIFLPYNAMVNVDALVRTCVRLFVTRRRLLEWETSSDSQNRTGSTAGHFVRTMLMVPLLSVSVLWLLDWGVREGMRGSLQVAPVFLATWFLSPLLAWFLSRPLLTEQPQLSGAQVELLRKTARSTWHYFDTFVGPDDHFLPPDNFQEFPAVAVAHRTSPTNIGCALLCNLAAYDFGYLCVGRLIERTAGTLATMGEMDRHHGHFFNWYDTRTLKPLPPLYLSSVDSGNLAGMLLTLRQGLLEVSEQGVIPARVFEGVRDTIHVLQGSVGADEERSVKGSAILGRMEQMLGEVEGIVRSPTACGVLLGQLTTEAEGLAGEVPTSQKGMAAGLARQVRDMHKDLMEVAGWVGLAAPPEEMWRRAGSETANGLGSIREMLRGLESMPTLNGVAELQRTLLPALDQLLAEGGEGAAGREWWEKLRQAVVNSVERASLRLGALEALAEKCDALAEMDFGFLYDKSRDLLAIGYNVADRRRDNSFYDLLSSEARLGSFVAVAQHQLPQEHWFAMGRRLTSAGGRPALLSWSGSMFEYLMPLLVMPTYANTLLDQTYNAVVRRQIEYGHERGVPWGISESGYNTTDAHLNYQYRAFGVPGLGYKRGLAEDVVIAPYATVMALMVLPREAARNMERMAGLGVVGTYGFYEAVDYTPARMPTGEDHVIIRSYMAHHQGMSLLSLAYLMLGQPMQRRFLSNPEFRANALLLQERVPRTMPTYPHTVEVEESRRQGSEAEASLRIFSTANTAAPELHLLSNGRYHVMVSNAGSGSSKWNDLAVTRWRVDPTRDCWGSYCYVRDLDTSEYWSSTYHPTMTSGDHYEANFLEGRAEFRRSDSEIETRTEIAVSPEEDIELRRVIIKNQSRTRRRIELTSYAEVVLATAAADAAHPAFSNLFVQTQIVRDNQGILCTRRPRSAVEKPPWMIHMLTVQGTTEGETTYETDRARFIGRGRRLDAPAAMEGGVELSGTEGAVLDPIVAIRRVLILEPYESARIDFVTGAADTQQAAVALMEKYRDPRMGDRVFEMAWTHSHVLLRQLDVSAADAQLFGRLLNSILQPNRLRRTEPAIMARNRRGQSGLWGHGISGDRPIVLLRVGDLTKVDLVRKVVQAHAYWRMKGLGVDLVIWNDDESGYRQELHDQIMGLIAAGPEAHLIDRPGGVFVRRAEQMSNEDRLLIQTVANVLIDGSQGTLAEQVMRRGRTVASVPMLEPVEHRDMEIPPAKSPARKLAYFNGHGGMTGDGKEYVITTGAGHATPAPWCNVIANARIGSVISESGSAYTFVDNAHEYRLTPWANDPVCDAGGEAFYIRDEKSGKFWSPSPYPAGGTQAYTSRHGFGYSVFEYVQDGIRSELWVYAAVEAPVKFAVIKIFNESGRARRLSVTGYWEWVLSEMRSKSLMHVVTEVDTRTGALLARNSYNRDFAEMIAFADVAEPSRKFTGDREEFIGRNGSYADPAAMGRTRLSGRTGAGLDACAGLQVAFDLAEGQAKEVVFILGAAQGLEEVRNLVHRFRNTEAARQELAAVWNYWNRTLGAVHIETPDDSVNMLANGWLLYQTLVCRMWARSGLYQSGGAYGFRDQLQDGMALLHATPLILREHLLRSARHQFREGDVQHWWHPPSGQGVRTKFSDDFLWLPLATARYVKGTGDIGVLNERVTYLEGRAVRPEEESYYDQPIRSDVSGSLYEHCVKAVENGLRFGSHGLPLIGCGDWNDGMNLIGEHGQGESVWLAFFLYYVLGEFEQVAQRRGDGEFALRCKTEAARLRGAIEQNGWDGEWYRRAYFDNGEPLGSASNDECQIDSLPQSWAIISQAGGKKRSAQGMAAADKRLVREDAGLIQLFDPPFDKSALNPGYIKGYVPGVRENGGQYTHAAIWMIMAYALMGNHERAWELFGMINPLHHGGTEEGIATYRVEPYVIAADVYGAAPHTGRGGWTWYTGSAGWMYRLIVETLLGIRLEVDRLYLTPRLPAAWNECKIHYRYRETFYHIHIRRSEGDAPRMRRDGVPQAELWIQLRDDRVDHQIEFDLPR